MSFNGHCNVVFMTRFDKVQDITLYQLECFTKLVPPNPKHTIPTIPKDFPAFNATKSLVCCRQKIQFSSPWFCLLRCWQRKNSHVCLQ